MANFKIISLYAGAVLLAGGWLYVAPRLLDPPRKEPVPVYTPAALPARPVPAFTLLDQSGKTVGLEELKGKAWVANFIFATCPGPCLDLTKKMRELDLALGDRDDVRLVSFSIDPTHDSPERLAGYAQKVSASDRWHFVTGDRAITGKVARDGFMVPLSDDPTDMNHSERIVVVDKRGQACAWFNSDSPTLVQDIRAAVEKL